MRVRRRQVEVTAVADNYMRRVVGIRPPAFSRGAYMAQLECGHERAIYAELKEVKCDICRDEDAQANWESCVREEDARLSSGGFRTGAEAETNDG